MVIVPPPVEKKGLDYNTIQAKKGDNVMEVDAVDEVPAEAEPEMDLFDISRYQRPNPNMDLSQLVSATISHPFLSGFFSL